MLKINKSYLNSFPYSFATIILQIFEIKSENTFNQQLKSVSLSKIK